MKTTEIEGVYAGFCPTLNSGRVMLLLTGTIACHLGETV